MGIVDYAATTCLAASGFALAAPFLSAKVPSISPIALAVAKYRQLVGIFGIGGGGLGLVVIPLLLLLLVGFDEIQPNLFVFFFSGLELLGCIATLALGIMVLRMPVSEEPHHGEIDFRTVAGLAGITYGGFLLLAMTIVELLA